MKTSRKRWIVGMAAGIAAVALALSGCSGGDAGGTEDGGGEDAGPTMDTLLIALPADPQNIYGSNTTNQRDLNLAVAMNEKLIEFTPEADDFEPRLAESWEQIDETTVEFTLREGVKFTNGEDFNAQSAAYSFEVMQASNSYASTSAFLDRAEVVDDYTLRIYSKAPTALILTTMALGSFQYPEALHKEQGVDEFALAPVGTGPYILGNWDKGVSLTMTANPDYWNGEADFKTLEFQIIPDFDSQVAALESGQVDFVASLPLDTISQVENSSVANLVTRPSNRIYYATLTTLKESPLSNPKVRQALQYAIDVDAIVETALDGHGTKLQGQILVPTFTGFNPSLEATEYDPEKAKKLLADAGYPDGFSIPLMYSQTNIPPVGEQIAAQLAEVGITTDQQLMESGAFLTKLVNLELEGIFYAGSLPAPDAGFMYDQFETGFRYGYYSNPKIDALLQEQRITADPEQRQEIFDEMVEEFDADPAFIPLFQGEDNYGINKAVEGFVPRASQFIDWHSLTS